ncbi:MAG: ATP-binding protein [Sulfolobales archaeon]
MSLKPIGLVGEYSTPTEVDVKSHYPVSPGTYVYISFKARDPVKDKEEVREVVGIVGSTVYRSVIPIVVSPNVGLFESYSSDLKRESYMKVLLVADITDGKAKFPTYPPPPETPVYLARIEHLRPIYSCEPTSGVRVGSLVGLESLEIRVRVNSLTKHLLIAGTTGSGKSNLVAVLADRIAQIGGSVVIFDVHGEYGGLTSESEDVVVSVYDAQINLLKVPIGLLANFIIPEPAATKQRRILRNALKKLNSEILEQSRSKSIPPAKAVEKLYASTESYKHGGALDKPLDPPVMYRELLKERIKRESDESKTVGDVIDKVDDFFEWHRVSLESPTVSELMGYGKIVVVDVSALVDDEKDYMLKVVAEDILWSLKEGAIPPTLLVVEEAHIFLNRETNTRSKGALQRFVREGRKFGGMLAVVSQRPRALDIGVVSQVQNFAFLRLVQKADRSVLMELADILSEEYANILPSLPPGHGVLIGEWTGWYPVYTRLDLHKGKRVGATPNIVEKWRRGRDTIKAEQEDFKSLASEWEGG